MIDRLLALRKGIEESCPDNAGELLGLVDEMIRTHRSQFDAIEQLGKEFLGRLYNESSDESPKQRYSRIACIAAGTVSPSFILHLFHRLEEEAAAAALPLAALAQTRRPREMALPPYVEEQAIVNGKVITRRRENNLRMPPDRLIEDADHLHNAHRRAGGRGRHGSEKQREALAERHAQAKAHWERLATSGRPERGIAALVAERMGVTPSTIRRWRHSNWGENQTNTS